RPAGRRELIGADRQWNPQSTASARFRRGSLVAIRFAPVRLADPGVAFATKTRLAWLACAPIRRFMAARRSPTRPARLDVATATAFTCPFRTAQTRAEWRPRRRNSPWPTDVATPLKRCARE